MKSIPQLLLLIKNPYYKLLPREKTRLEAYAAAKKADSEPEPTEESEPNEDN